MSKYYKPGSSKRKYNGPTSSSTDFYDAVRSVLDEVTNNVVPIMDDVTVDVAKDAVKRLKATSPKDSGEYAKGWAYKKEAGRLRTTTIVYGKDGTYQLAHLLEYGHVTRNGTGRTDFRDTPAHPHVKAVADWCQDEAPKRMFNKLENMKL